MSMPLPVAFPNSFMKVCSWRFFVPTMRAVCWEFVGEVRVAELILIIACATLAAMKGRSTQNPVETSRRIPPHPLSGGERIFRTHGLSFDVGKEFGPRRPDSDDREVALHGLCVCLASLLVISSAGLGLK